MKKFSKVILIIVLALTLALSLSLIACKDKNNSEPEEVKVSFDGGELQPINISSDEIASPDPQPREGFVFLGWVLEDNETFLTAEYLKNATGNIAVTAKWAEYALGEFTYNIEKIAIKVNDTVNATLFGAQLLDNASKSVTIETTLNGEQKAGETVSVTLVATGDYGLTKEITIENIKVYGMPTLEFNIEKSHINKADVINAALFSATGKDSFNENTTINVSIKEATYNAGDKVTVVLTSTDAAGNKVTKEKTDVKVYGKPSLSYTETKTFFNMSDELKPSLFNVKGKDTFGDDTTTSISVKPDKYGNTDYIGGFIVTLLLTSTDKYGNKTTKEAPGIKVYGEPIVSYTKKNVKAVDETTNNAALKTLFDVSAKDSFGVDISSSIFIERIGAEIWVAGSIIKFKVDAQDSKNNVAEKYIEGVRVYGNPTLEYNQTKDYFHVLNALDSALFDASGKDTFGENTAITVSVQEGEYCVSDIVTVDITSTDVVGNQTTQTIENVKVYGNPIIVWTREAMKVTENSADLAEEIIAKDSFDNPSNKEVSVMGDQFPGETLTFRVIATDDKGHRQAQDYDIKVYGEPVITYVSAKTTVRKSDVIMAGLFGVSAKDSFNELIANENIVVTPNGTQEVGQTMSFTITATDFLGNTKNISIENIEVVADPTYQRINQDGTPNETGGEYVLFGEYPQTIKSNDVVITAETTDSRGYYLGSDGEFYSKITAHPNHPTSTFSNGENVYSYTTYYFKVEPIKWRILNYDTLDTDANKALLFSEVALVNRRYNEWYEGMQNGVYANNYEYSEIRAWLNSKLADGTSLDYGFFKTAFSVSEKNQIDITAVDNSASTTETSPNMYASDTPTNDKIFLLSYEEVTNANYGFNESTERIIEATDYSIATGIYIHYGSNNVYTWYTRSPSANSSTRVAGVVDGSVGGNDDAVGVSEERYGVAPALTIQLA